MMHDWAQGRADKLTSLNIARHFEHEFFPKFSIGAGLYPQAVAYYGCDHHTVVFSEAHWNKYDASFLHVYFHELIHSTTLYCTRLSRLNESISCKTSFENAKHLEERIADLGGMILEELFGGANYDSETILKVMAAHPTIHALPWADFVTAITCYLRNKRCPVLVHKLEYYKTVLKDGGYSIQEGYFSAGDWRSHVKSSAA